MLKKLNCDLREGEQNKELSNKQIDLIINQREGASQRKQEGGLHQQLSSVLKVPYCNRSTSLDTSKNLILKNTSAKIPNIKQSSRMHQNLKKNMSNPNFPQELNKQQDSNTDSQFQTRISSFKQFHSNMYEKRKDEIINSEETLSQRFDRFGSNYKRSYEEGYKEGLRFNQTERLKNAVIILKEQLDEKERRRIFTDSDFRALHKTYFSVQTIRLLHSVLSIAIAFGTQYFDSNRRDEWDSLWIPFVTVLCIQVGSFIFGTLVTIFWRYGGSEDYLFQYQEEKERLQAQEKENQLKPSFHSSKQPLPSTNNQQLLSQSFLPQQQAFPKKQAAVDQKEKPNLSPMITTDRKQIPQLFQLSDLSQLPSRRTSQETDRNLKLSSLSRQGSQNIENKGASLHNRFSHKISRITQFREYLDFNKCDLVLLILCIIEMCFFVEFDLIVSSNHMNRTVIADFTIRLTLLAVGYCLLLRKSKFLFIAGFITIIYAPSRLQMETEFSESKTSAIQFAISLCTLMVFVSFARFRYISVLDITYKSSIQAYREITSELAAKLVDDFFDQKDSLSYLKQIEELHKKIPPFQLRQRNKKDKSSNETKSLINAYYLKIGKHHQQSKHQQQKDVTLKINENSQMEVSSNQLIQNKKQASYFDNQVNCEVGERDETSQQEKQEQQLVLPSQIQFYRNILEGLNQCYVLLDESSNYVTSTNNFKSCVGMSANQFIEEISNENSNEIVFLKFKDNFYDEWQHFQQEGGEEYSEKMKNKKKNKSNKNKSHRNHQNQQQISTTHQLPKNNQNQISTSQINLFPPSILPPQFSPIQKPRHPSSPNQQNQLLNVSQISKRDSFNNQSLRISSFSHSKIDRRNKNDSNNYIQEEEEEKKINKKYTPESQEQHSLSQSLAFSPFVKQLMRIKKHFIEGKNQKGRSLSSYQKNFSIWCKHNQSFLLVQLNPILINNAINFSISISSRNYYHQCEQMLAKLDNQSQYIKGITNYLFYLFHSSSNTLRQAKSSAKLEYSKLFIHPLFQKVQSALAKLPLLIQIQQPKGVSQLTVTSKIISEYLNEDIIKIFKSHDDTSSTLLLLPDISDTRLDSDFDKITFILTIFAERLISLKSDTSILFLGAQVDQRDNSFIEFTIQLKSVEQVDPLYDQIELQLESELTLPPQFEEKSTRQRQISQIGKISTRFSFTASSSQMFNNDNLLLNESKNLQTSQWQGQLNDKKNEDNITFNYQNNTKNDQQSQGEDQNNNNNNNNNNMINNGKDNWDTEMEEQEQREMSMIQVAQDLCYILSGNQRKLEYKPDSNSLTVKFYVLNLHPQSNNNTPKIERNEQKFMQQQQQLQQQQQYQQGMKTMRKSSFSNFLADKSTNCLTIPIQFDQLEASDNIIQTKLNSTLEGVTPFSSSVDFHCQAPVKTLLQLTKKFEDKSQKGEESKQLHHSTSFISQKGIKQLQESATYLAGHDNSFKIVHKSTKYEHESMIGNEFTTSKNQQYKNTNGILLVDSCKFYHTEFLREVEKMLLPTQYIEDAYSAKEAILKISQLFINFRLQFSCIIVEEGILLSLVAEINKLLKNNNSTFSSIIIVTSNTTKFSSFYQYLPKPITQTGIENSPIYQILNQSKANSKTQ